MVDTAGRGPQTPDRAGAPLLERRLPLVALVVGVWAVLPPYVGPTVEVEPRVEFADHVVPGVVVIVLSLAVLAAGARAARGTTPMFVSGALIALAAVWIIATHVPLLAQASRGEVSTFAALYHAAPGLGVAAVAGVWLARNWGDGPSRDDAPPAGG